MSRPILSSATRRLSTQPICHRSLSTSRLVSNLFSASSDTPASRSFSSPLNTSRGTRPLRCQVRRLEVSPFAAPRHRAAFTSSSVRPASRLVQNARTNEEGNSLTVDISARAAEVRLYLFSFLFFFFFFSVLRCVSCEEGMQVEYGCCGGSHLNTTVARVV